MLKNYTNVFDEIKEQIVFITSGDDDDFVMGKDFMRMKFKTDDVLPYNEKINVSICVIAISSIFEQNGVYYPQITSHDCFYEYEYCRYDDYCFFSRE